MKKTNVFIVGGHFTPALGVYEEIKDSNTLNIYYIGVKHTILFDKSFSKEYEFCKNNNIKFLPLYTGKIYRYLSLESLISFIRIPLGFIQSFFYILKYKPNIIVTFGSYVSVPVIISAKLLNIKILSHIQTIKPGIADKISFKMSDKIFISWKESEEYIKNKNKIIYSGNILRKEIFKYKSEHIHFENNNPIIYITGGNQGSHLINTFIFNNIEKLLEKYNLIHQIGSNTIYDDFTKAISIKNSLSHENSSKYLIYKGIWDNEIGEVLNISNIIVGRSGANTVYEILALNKKAIFIPLEIGDKGDQIYNAKMAQNYSNNIHIIKEKDLTFNNFSELIEKLLKNNTDIKEILPKDAALIISKEISQE